MTLDEFKKLKAGDKLTTLGVISSRSGENGENFVVPAGTVATVSTGEICYVEEIDDIFCMCEVEYTSSSIFYEWHKKRQSTKLGQIAVNPADVSFA